MDIAIAVGKDKGLSLFGKRLSSDRELRKKLASMYEKIYLDSYSVPLFQEDGINIEIADKATDAELPDFIPDNAVFFNEKRDISNIHFDRLILFNWNRTYLADKQLDIDLKKFKRVSKEDFKGYSHQKITMEVYERK